MGFTAIFWKYMMKNVHLPKNQCLIAIWGWDIGVFMLQWLHTNPCNFVLVLTPLEQSQNYKDLYGVTGTWKHQYLIPKLQ